MESQPLIAKSNVIPNLDVTYLIREIFQAEFESHVPSKKLAENLRKSLEYERLEEDLEEQKSFRSVSFLENLSNEKGKLMDYAEKVFDAYGNHEEALNRIARAELNIMETQAIYLRREGMIRDNDFLQDLLRLKRHPLMRSYNPEFVKQFKLLQGESGLPPEREAQIDFRTKDFQKCKKRVVSLSQDSLAMKFLNWNHRKQEEPKACQPKEDTSVMRRAKRPKKVKAKEQKSSSEVLRANPPAVSFQEYTPGSTYECTVSVTNVHTKPVRFCMKPLPMYGPFKVRLGGTETTRILPGLSVRLVVTFSPQSLDDENEHLILLIEDGTRFVIPLASYLEPPLLKTHEELDEFTKNVPERIRCSYIDCGPCFPGDSKVKKIRFYSFGGAGEFFVMSQENWSNWHIDRLTADNFTDIPPFRLYPSYFKIDKNQVVDLYVEFKPAESGLHSDSIIVACNNGEIRNLDILGDGVSWNRSYISFEKSLEKDFSALVNDDHRATYYLDMGGTLAGGTVKKSFCLFNNSNVPFEFRWEMRDAVILFKGHQEPGKLSRSQVKVEPSSGVLEPCAERRFIACVALEKCPVGQYRTVLSLYVVGLPYQSIEQACTIIRPSVTPQERFKSGSVFGEEDNLPISPEFSYQGTYESVQESMKTSESKYQEQFPMNVCRKHPSICAIPLKKSKTFSNIGEDDDCTCCPTTALDTTEPDKSHCYGFGNSFQKREKPNITDLGSNLLWDFVDVLVDEIELWAEVLFTVVTLEPPLINTFDDVRIMAPPVRYDVYVHNQNSAPITCKWLKFSEKHKRPPRPEESRYQSNTFYHVGGSQKVGVDDGTAPHKGKSPAVEKEQERLSNAPPTSAESATDRNVSCCASHECHLNSGDVPGTSDTIVCDITVEPEEAFTIRPHSRFWCVLSVSACQAGNINRELYLSVEEGEQVLQLYVVGRVPSRGISVTPSVLDFGSQRQGTRCEKHFKIRNESAHQVEWRVEMYKFNYTSRTLTKLLEDEALGSLRNLKGVLEGGGCTIESYKLDAKRSGLQTSILNFELSAPAFPRTRSKYIAVLADVQTPQLVIEAPRFNNAILAPSKTMYVGQTITQNITLRNMKNVATTYIWGYPFGCHCRKLSLTMCPKFCVIGKMKKVVVEVNITPLEEGIVEHCYVPCFFSRNANPVVLSIVGIIKNLQVTFEIANESSRFCDDQRVMKISWPIRNFDPQIGMSHIPERKILDFVCHCDEVDAEYLRATDAVEEAQEEVENAVPAAEDAGEMDAEESAEVRGEETPLPRKYHTADSVRKLGDIMRGREKEGGPTEPEEELENEDQLSVEGSSESSAVAEYPTDRECIDALYYAVSEMQFVNVLSKTVAEKHFVIKNETPIRTAFTLRVRYFAKADQSHCQSKMKEIERRVFGRRKGELEESLIYGQPLLIATSPSEGNLDGWESVRVSVFVFGNTWGEYRDFIVCDISGMPSFVMKVSVQLSGHPVLFPMFRTSLLDIPVLRLNTAKYKADPVVTSIRVLNSSSIPITVTWMVFLTSPLPEVAKDEPFSLCLDMYTDKDSEDPEKATKSSRNYLSKNTSGSVPLLDMMDMEKVSSRYTGMEGMSEMDSSKKDSPTHVRCFNNSSNGTPTLFTDSTKPEIQLLENYGKMDLYVFQVSPRELDLEPYSEERMTITFDPNYYEPTESLQEFEAVVTGCVRLKQEYALYPDIYRRPCGKDYVSKLLFVSGAVEKPLLHFDMFKEDLRYFLNANEVIRTKGNGFRMTRKYLAKNRNQTTVSTRVKVEPGDVFSVGRIETFIQVFEKFHSDDQSILIQPGSSLEVQLELVVTHNQIKELFKTFTLDMRKSRKRESHAKSSELILAGDVRVDSSRNGGERDKISVTEEKVFCDIGSTISHGSNDFADSNAGLTVRQIDSYHLFDNKAKKWKCAKKIEQAGLRSFSKSISEEELAEAPAEVFYGEDLELIHSVDSRSEEKADSVLVVTEDLVFEQVGLLRQVITLELHVIFPSLKVNPETLDFGNVYIGNSSRRYASVINLTQYPTEFSVTWSEEAEGFSVSPTAARLPAINYKSDSGVELTVDFIPKRPGYFKKTFKIYGNKEMEFQPFVFNVLGFATWNEKYKYSEAESSTRLPPIMSLPFGK